MAVSSDGRWRDISLLGFSSSEQLSDYLFEYINANYPHVNMINEQKSVVDLCRIAIDQSNQLLISNSDELSRVTSRHIWPPNHKLLMGCLANAHIVATCHDQSKQKQEVQYEEHENNDTCYCLITQLGNDPTHIKFVHGTDSLRQEIFERFKHPFKTTVKSSPEQIDLFLFHAHTLSIQAFCDYVTSYDWHSLGEHSLWSVLVDFIIADQPLLFDQDI